MTLTTGAGYIRARSRRRVSRTSHRLRQRAPKRWLPAEGLEMIGQGEGLELLAVFITVIGSLALLVAFGKWWEA